MNSGGSVASQARGDPIPLQKPALTRNGWHALPHRCFCVRQLRLEDGARRWQIGSMQTRWLAVFLFATFAWFQSASAVVINTATGNSNTNAPANDPGWANIGTLGGGTGIYLGDGWVLTAAHVGAGAITLQGIAYNPVPGSAVQLTNNTPGKTALSDLLLFQLSSMPAGLGSLTLASSTPTLNAPVVMIGAGRDRGAFTQWTIDQATTPWTWTEVSSGGNAAGYQTLESRAMRWGTNTIDATDVWFAESPSGPDVKSFATLFEDSGLSDNEAQASLGDSGGAVFTHNGSSWELHGVMFDVEGFSGQPSPEITAIFGNDTLSADLSYYAPQIMTIIPEPSIYALLSLSAAAAIFAGRRARR